MGLQILSSAIERRSIANSRVSILTGLLFDDAGNRMSPSHCHKDGVRYRYYVSRALLQHDRTQAGSIARVAAPDIETAVRSAIGSGDITNIQRITVYPDHLAIELKAEDRAGDHVKLAIPFDWKPQARRKGIVREPAQRQRIDPDAAQGLLIAIAKARSWMQELINSSTSTDVIALREKMGERNVRKLLPLACLSPTVIRAIADGSAPADLNIRQLTAALPHAWNEQEQRLLVG